MQLLKQSTAATVLVGPVLDSAGLAITTAVIGDFQLTKNGSTAALASPATATHSHNGNYLIALTTGNTDTAGRLVITVNNAAQAMGTHRYTVLVASVFDAIVTNATNTTGGLPTATGTISALAGAVSTLTAGGVRTELTTELGRIDATIGSRATQTSVDTIDDLIDTEVAAIKAKTDNLPANPAAVSDIPTAVQIADGVWDEATSGHTTAGTTGKALIDSGAAGNPWSTDLSAGYSGTQAGNVLNAVKAKTDTITTQTINVYPVSASTPERVAGTTITYYRNEIRSVSVVTDFTLTNLTLSFTVEDAEGTDLLTIANASITRSSQTFTVSIGTAATSSTGNKRWALRDLTGGTNSVIARGIFSVQEAASA